MRDVHSDPELARAGPSGDGQCLLTIARNLCLMGVALFLTLFPFTIRFGDGRITWAVLERPSAVLAANLIAAVACWAGFFYVRSRRQGTSL